MKKAFTLAELLITLAIVGVIAVLTVPNIIKNAQGRAQIALLQSTYGQLQDALKQVMLEQRVTDWSDVEFELTNENDTVEMEFMKKYLSVINDCGSSSAGCFAETYNEISRSRTRNDFLKGYNAFALLKNGAAVGFEAPDRNAYGPISGKILIDVNGAKKPNTLGRDLFFLVVEINGELSAYPPSSDSTLTEIAEDCASFDGYFYSCFDYLQKNNWVMDY